MLLHALLLALLMALGTAQPCWFSGERKSRDRMGFERCDFGETRFSGCADAEGRKVSDGEEFDSGARSLHYNRQRYRLKCSVTNTFFRSSLRGRLVGCYDIDGKLAAKGEEYLWYSPLYRHSRYSRFTHRCHEEDGIYGFRIVGCRGAKNEQIDFGESYQPKPDDPDFIFDCVGNSTSASFNLRGSAADDSAESSGELQDASAEARRDRLQDRLRRMLGGGGGLDLSGCRCPSPPCLSAPETYFYRCEGRDQVVLGCVDEKRGKLRGLPLLTLLSIRLFGTAFLGHGVKNRNGMEWKKQLVENGDVFRFKDRGNDRFLVFCKVRNDTLVAVSVEMLGCYDSAGVLKNPGEEFGHFDLAKPFSELIGYTKLCRNTEGSFSARAVACAGRNGVRVAFGEDFAPLPGTLPDLVFQCRRQPNGVSFNQKPKCSDEAVNFRCLAVGEATDESTVECVPKTWRCDGNNDCGNGKDELGC